MKLRRLTKKDIPAALRIIKENYPADSRYYPKARREIVAMFHKETFGPRYIAAEEKGKLVGFGGYSQSWIDYDGYGLFWVNVQKDAQGRRIGTEIVKSLISEIQKGGRGTYILIITTRQNFYRRLGFRKIANVTAPYVLMILRLKKKSHRGSVYTSE